MKKISMIFTLLLVMVSLAACGGSKETKADYTTKEAEAALNKGDDLTGKTVKIKVDEYVPDGALGYTIQTGEHLNFVSSEDPKVKKGEELVVKVTKVSNVMGSFVINYEKN